MTRFVTGMNDEIIRLLEKKWSDLRHVETERHWILTAYAVIVAGVLSLIVDPDNSDTRNAISYLLLAILGLIGGLHSFRAAWLLREVQESINVIVSRWKEGLNSETSTYKDYKDFWSFSTRTNYVRSPKIEWFFSQYCFWRPNFSVAYAFIYSLAVVCCLGFSIWIWTR